jgi:hypothetical protein
MMWMSVSSEHGDLGDADGVADVGVDFVVTSGVVDDASCSESRPAGTMQSASHFQSVVQTISSGEETIPHMVLRNWHCSRIVCFLSGPCASAVVWRL